MTRLFALLGALALVGCQQRDQAQARTAIEGIWTEYASSLNAGDADRWLALWDEDGVQLPPDAPPVEGKAEISSKIRGILNQFAFEMEIQNKEMRTAGDWAYARGTYQAKLTPKGGGPAIPIDGKFMTILKKQNNGVWKLYRDIFNSNVPPVKSD